MDDTARSSNYSGILIDVYAFGILMHAIFTGSKPYNEEARMNLWSLVFELLFSKVIIASDMLSFLV